jgi:DNA-binding HxlR family transcriptional regulator
MARPYVQYCPVAHSLELVGERWSLLIVRDLLKGPKRYGDLLAGLPGLGTNILAARLKELEEGGVVRKTKLPPPANVTVYELTEYGADLEEVIQALGRWGFRSLGPPPTGCPLPEGWLVQGSRTLFDPVRAGGLEESYEVRVGDEVATIRISDGKLDADPGGCADVDAVLELDIGTLFALARGEMEAKDAIAHGLARVEGDPEALQRFVSVFDTERYGHQAEVAVDVPEERLRARELPVAADVAVLRADDEHHELARSGVRHAARRRRLDVDQPAGPELDALVRQVEDGVSLVDEVQLVLLLVVVGPPGDAGLDDEDVRAEGGDPERAAHLPEGLVAELVDRRVRVPHRE